MREYETILVLDAALDGEAVDGEINRVVKMIEDNSGDVREIQRWGRRRLAYPIKKKPDGIYAYLRYGGNNEVLSEIDRRCALNESMLRFMTVVIEHPHGVAPSWAQEGRPAESATGPRSAGGARERRAPAPAVTRTADAAPTPPSETAAAEEGSESGDA